MLFTKRGKWMESSSPTSQDLFHAKVSCNYEHFLMCVHSMWLYIHRHSFGKLLKFRFNSLQTWRIHYFFFNVQKSPKRVLFSIQKIKRETEGRKGNDWMAFPFEKNNCDALLQIFSAFTSTPKRPRLSFLFLLLLISRVVFALPSGRY